MTFIKHVYLAGDKRGNMTWTQVKGYTVIFIVIHHITKQYLHESY